LSDAILPIRFHRWLLKTNAKEFTEFFSDVCYTAASEHMEKTVKELIALESPCTCDTKHTKFKTLVRIVKLQDDDVPEKLGFWLKNLVDDTPGRERGILLAGFTPGCGKTTVAAALSHLIDEQMVFSPDVHSPFCFQNYSSALCRLLYLNEFRTSAEGLTSALLLGILEGCRKKVLNQKNAGGVKFINKKSKFVPRCIMTTNYVKITKTWTKEDVMALKSRMGVLLFFACAFIFDLLVLLLPFFFLAPRIRQHSNNANSFTLFDLKFYQLARADDLRLQRRGVHYQAPDAQEF
jgi:hypothetical protein